jgi:hypothetical protein
VVSDKIGLRVQGSGFRVQGKNLSTQLLGFSVYLGII